MDESQKSETKKSLLAISLFINVGLLVIFKYANFFIENVNSSLSVLGFENIAWTAIALPIGISFYTFQTLTYSIDVYRKVQKPLEKVSDYLLYIMSFPQMIAGPIVRFNSIAGQITNRSETIDDKLMGFFRFSIGLAKKVLIANTMGAQADLIFNGNLSEISMSAAWVGILAYTFQIYFDFSGYSDMAIGLGRIMGFRFPENFNNPYTSKSISEFWRKWHITLGTWMKDYLYIPLGGNRVSTKARLYFNLWIVFLLSGLWHGASWNFVLWGAFHGLFLILDRLFLLKFFSKIGNLPSMLITFFIVIIGWVLFRVENINDAGIYLSKMIEFSSVNNLPETVTTFNLKFILAVVFSFITLSKFGRKAEQYVFYSDKYSFSTYLVFTIISLVLFVASLISVMTSGFNPFIYFRF